MFPQRHTRVLRFEIPTRSFERRLRHAMPTHRPHQVEYLSRTFYFFTQHHWAKKLRQGRPRSFRPLVAIKRPFSGRTLAPPFTAVRIGDTRQDDATLSSSTKTCLKKVNERQANLAQFNRLDKQGKNLFLRDTHYARRSAVLTTKPPNHRDANLRPD